MPRSWTTEDSMQLAAMIHADSNWFKLRRAWPSLPRPRLESQLRQLVKRKKLPQPRKQQRQRRSQRLRNPLIETLRPASFIGSRHSNSRRWLTDADADANEDEDSDADEDSPDTDSPEPHLPNWHTKHSEYNTHTTWSPREYCILAACVYRGVSPLLTAVRFHNRSVAAVQQKYRGVKNEMFVEAARMEMRGESEGGTEASGPSVETRCEGGGDGDRGGMMREFFASL